MGNYILKTPLKKRIFQEEEQELSLPRVFLYHRVRPGGQNKNKRNNFAWLKIELLHKYIIQMIEYNNNITYKKNFGIWFACIGFELLTCDLAPVVQEAGWSFQSFSTHLWPIYLGLPGLNNRWKFQSFQDSFLGLSWWKPLSYWVQTLYKSAISRKEPRILKPSSNSGLALASITGPATDPSH